MKIVDNKCPACNDNLFYDIKNKHFKCKSCHCIYTFEKLKQQELKIKKISEELFCPNCSARIFFNDNSLSTKCIYCNSNVVIQKTKDKYLIPDKIIPFSITERQSREILKRNLEAKKLIPVDFCLDKNITEIKGVYIPFWLYSNKYKVKIYHDSVYRVNSFQIAFDLIPFDANKHLDNNLTKGLEPYNYEELIDYHPAFLSGFLAQKYDIESKKGEEEINKRCKATIHNLFKKPTSRYYIFDLKIVRETLLNQKEYYALLPIWLININYKNKDYLIAINGQTGQLSSNLPINNKKYNMVKIYTFLTIFMILLLLAFILRRNGVL